MRVKCEIDRIQCELPGYIVPFFLKKSMIYVCTIDRDNNPNIQSFLFVNEPGKCILAFLVNKTARVMKNLKHNPVLTFTLDKTHPIDPMQNEGIMVEATMHLNSTQLEIERCYNEIQNKYGIDIATKILGMEVLSDFVSIRATPTKIVYWKGPFFRKFECQKRKSKITEK